tara:strand:- start:3795 stop:4211 length:417 start_codon:yes stop_codon:yes gene_type:complete
MNRKQNSLLRKLTKEFLFEDVDVEDQHGDSQSLDLKVESVILDYGESSKVEDEDEDENLDLKQFSSKIANLVENYDNVLDIPSYIVNDAVKYLQKTYDDSIASEFKKILFDVYDIKLDSLDDDVEAPMASGAGPISGT